MLQNVLQRNSQSEYPSHNHTWTYVQVTSDLRHVYPKATIVRNLTRPSIPGSMTMITTKILPSKITVKHYNSLEIDYKS